MGFISSKIPGISLEELKRNTVSHDKLSLHQDSNKYAPAYEGELITSWRS